MWERLQPRSRCRSGRRSGFSRDDPTWERLQPRFVGPGIRSRLSRSYGRSYGRSYDAGRSASSSLAQESRSVTMRL